MIRLVCISDTHNAHNQLIVPDGDILVHCGDITMGGIELEFKDFNDWLGTLPHKYKIVIAGNHDLLLEKSSKTYKNRLFSNAKYLENDGYTIEEYGLKIWGSPITPEFNNWAFMKQRGAEIAKVWEKIPENIDLLLTHGPPYGILDLVEYRGPQGCSDLKEAIKRVKPKFHIFGHIHEGYGAGRTTGLDTGFINCSIMNRFYDPVNRPVIIDLESDTNE